MFPGNLKFLTFKAVLLKITIILEEKSTWKIMEIKKITWRGIKSSMPCESTILAKCIGTKTKTNNNTCNSFRAIYLDLVI